MLNVRIDLAAFRHNLAAIKSLAPGAAILPVIKADGYGHGMIALARESLKFGAPMLGVGALEEGRTLRREKIAAPALLLDGIFPEEAADAVKYRLTPVVFSLDVAKELNRAGKKAGKKIAVHLKFDTGMGRLGFTLHQAIEAVTQIAKMKNIHVEGVMTHFASASDVQSPQTDNQLRRFAGVLEVVKKTGLKPLYIHAANSAAILNYKQSHYGMVRPGIALYGAPPTELKGLAFKPVMSVTSRLISVKDIPQGEGIGYNATYVTPRNKKVGVVLGGYADGINRLLSNRGLFLVRGKPVPIIGNVCMDMVMVDLSRVPSAAPGDEVVILGGGVPETSAEHWAELAGTIPYEIFCRLGVGPRAQRSYK